MGCSSTPCNTSSGRRTRWTRYHATTGTIIYHSKLIRWFARRVAGRCVSTRSLHSDRFRCAHEEHIAILKAIETGDAEAAERTAREHVRKGQAHPFGILFLS